MRVNARQPLHTVAFRPRGSLKCRASSSSGILPFRACRKTVKAQVEVQAAAVTARASLRSVVERKDRIRAATNSHSETHPVACERILGHRDGLCVPGRECLCPAPLPSDRNAGPLSRSPQRTNDSPGAVAIRTYTDRCDPETCYSFPFLGFETGGAFAFSPASTKRRISSATRTPVSFHIRSSASFCSGVTRTLMRIMGEPYTL